jgi:hypothetical protein
MIRLLQDFDDSTFQKVHGLALLAEDDWLEDLNRVTKKRFEQAQSTVGTDRHM